MAQSYWQKRFEMLEDARNKTAKQTVQSVTPAFDKAQAQIDKEINAWYARFAKNNQISLQEAKKLLNTKELKEFKWDVQEYIKYGRQNALDQKWMKELENASARFHISRLEALKIRTQNAAEQAFGNELDEIDQMAARVYMDDYYHTAYEIQKGLGIGWDVSQIDQRKLDNILSKPWTTDKMTFSDRIWKSKTQLIDSLHTEMTQMCVLGKAPDQAINAIARRMNVSKGQAGRLIMTEAAYFGSAAQKDCFNDLDVEKYEIVATLDNRTSEVCQQMDGKVFDMKDFQAGVTAPPFHVWCRSCTAPWFEDNDDGTRAARGADGKTYQVPASMKYDDWKEYFVDKTKDPADWLKVATVGDIVKANEELLALRKSIKDRHDPILTTVEQKQEFADIVDGMTKEQANLYEKMGVNFGNNNYHKRGGAYYSPGSGTVNMDIDSNKWELAAERTAHGAWKTKFHEELHQVDHILGWHQKTPFAQVVGNPKSFTPDMTNINSVTGSKMIQAIDEDVLNLINKAVDWDVATNGVAVKHINTLGRISSDAKDATIRFLKDKYPSRKDKALISVFTDAVGMTTRGNLHPYKYGFWGHDASYCKQFGKDGATSEVWAELCSGLLRNDQEMIDAFKDLMPNTVKVYSETLDEVMEWAKSGSLTYRSP